MRQRFWLWLYKLARARLPADYYDEVFAVYLGRKLKELENRLGEYFVCWVVNNIGAAPPEMQARDVRDEQRDLHYPR